MRKILSFLFVCFTLSLHAQQIKLSFTPVAKFEDDVVSFHKYGKFFYSDKADYVREQVFRFATLKRMKNGIELTQYDENLKKIKTLSLDNNQKDLGPFPPLVHYGKTFIYVVYFKYINDDVVKMYVTKINPEDLSLMATKELMEYNQKTQGIWSAFKVLSETKILFTVSPDQKKVWVVHASPTLFCSTVIDGDLNVLQPSETIPVKLSGMKVMDSHLSNNGDKVLLYRYNGTDSWHGVFFHTSGKKPVFENIRVPAGVFPSYLHMLFGKNGKLFYGGHYNVERNSEKQMGVAFGEINVGENAIKTPALYPYSEELKEAVRDLNFATKSKGTIDFIDQHPSYLLNEMEDGTVVLSADMAARTSSAIFGRIDFFRGPIIHVFVKPDGKATMDLIAKNQQYDASTNFIVRVFKDKFVCIYGDLPKGHKRKAFMIPVANVYNSNGELLSRRFLLENTKEMEGKIMIGKGSQIDDNKFILPVGEDRVSLSRYYTRIKQLAYLDLF